MAAAARELSLYESQLYAWRSKLKNAHSSSERGQEMSVEIALLRRQRNEDISYGSPVMLLSVRPSRRHNSVMVRPRLADELPVYNVKTIAASLRRQGLCAKAARKFSRSATVNTVCRYRRICWIRASALRGPNQKWWDITYLRTDEGWLYLAMMIDLWSRAVIGWSMSP